MKLLTPKFYLSFGLVSLLLSVLLLAVFLKILPDRQNEIYGQRTMLAESVASSSSLFLRSNDFGSIRDNLEFVVERNTELLYASVVRFNDQSRIGMGDERVLEQTALTERMSVPLYRGSLEWGQVDFHFAPMAGTTWLEKIQRSTLWQSLFIVLLSFCGFYFYLGRMLKQLNPSAAVPARVRSALDTIAESLIVINRKGEIVLANTAFASLVNQEPEALLGLDANSLAWERDDVDESDDENPAHPWSRTLETAEPVRGDMLWMRDTEGVRRKFIVNCSPVAASGGKVGGVLISLDDVTLLEHKEVELLRSKEEAETANRAKSEFLSNMSHEIRTPMTAILGFTEVLKRGYTHDEATAQKHLSTIGRSGKHLLELINDILDLSKVESGALSVESIRCEPHLLVHDVIQVLGVKAAEKSIFLRHEIPEALPEYIFSDPSRVRQIITNLVGNAIKFTETGGVTVRLRLIDDKEQKQLAIDVTDTGIGMTEEQVAGIFEAFVQADTTITRRFGGTGLGLSISRNLSQALGGDIVVTSAPGQGSTFTAIVSAGAIDDVACLSPDKLREAMDSIEATAHQSWVFSDKTVLVVDDAQENRDLLELLLNDMNITTHLAENGLLATEAIQQHEIDLVLMDIQMPVMDGYEASRVMREIGYTAPVVALTANAMKGFEKELEEQTGFSHYMTKPIDIDKLTSLLASLLDGQLAPEPSANPDTELVQPSPAVAQPSQHYCNTLVQENEKFRPLAQRFLDQLDDKLSEMQSAADNHDFETLASLGHWLKGSGGSVGFGVLSDPAANLELAAKNSELEHSQALVLELKTLSQALTLDPVLVEKVGDVTKNAANESDVEVGSADSPIYSSLIKDGPQFIPLVQRFIPRLRENLVELDTAISNHDYDTIASLAHWLKGSGGNVGFHVFTSPARELELAAKQNNDADIKRWFAEILSLESRICLSDDLPLANAVG